NVSHELRTPMTAIKGYVDNMLDGIAGDVTERQERYLNRVKSNADRLTRLINDLLDLSRIDRGRTDLLQLNMSPIQLNDVVHEAVDGLRPLADAAGLKLVYQGEDNLAMADRDRLIQMVTNLAGNAIKFTESGGEVRVSVRSDGTGFIQTVVKDTGKGIPAEDLSKIFDRFHQVKGTMGGTGLGLPITKELADLHGGEVWAESEMGHGSTFTFTIPEAKMG
ncbi:MAG: HAMP domain-containing histidine kinase, partial [Candidatus Latescibacteria bacterium]|nr:HAMP domain-containing histidine kinase [Candidatus Latescibacterota bacterium]